MTYKTEQEAFWAGAFGDDYISRNSLDRLLTPKIALWSKMLASAHGIQSVRELGCNVGGNLLALSKLCPHLELEGIEINEQAANAAQNLGIATIKTGSILDNHSDHKVDLTFTAGVLIHINPDMLAHVYRNLLEGTSIYVLVAEYYNPSPVSIPYRGNADRLFKRDFAGELMDQFGLALVDYGFVYKRDNWAPQDDITWFLLEKP